MHDFLDIPVRELNHDRFGIIAIEVLDDDLLPEWIGAASAHLRRRGYTLRSAFNYIRVCCPAYRSKRWTYLRSVLVGRTHDPRLLFAIRALPNKNAAS